MTTPGIVLTRGQDVRLAGADVGSLTLESGAATFSDQGKDGEPVAHVLELGKRTDVSEAGDVFVVGHGVSSRVTAHEEPAPKSKPKSESKPKPKKK